MQKVSGNLMADEAIQELMRAAPSNDVADKVDAISREFSALREVEQAARALCEDRYLTVDSALSLKASLAKLDESRKGEAQ